MATATAPNSVEKFFESAWSWIKKAFTTAENEAPAIMATANAIAPEAEAIFALTDPAAAAIVNPIVNEVQADLATVVTMAKNGSFSSIPNFITSIKANFSTLVSEAHIKDAGSLAKAQGILSSIVAALNSISASAQAATPAAA